MITVQLNEPDFEYDIHSLVKAFYPQHDVLVKAMPREEFPESVFHLVVNYDRKNHMIDFKFYEREQQENGAAEEKMTKASEQIPGLFRRRILFVTEHFTCIRQKHGGS